MKEKPGGKTM